MNRSKFVLDDEISDGAGVARWRHIAIARRWRRPEPVQIKGVTIQLRAHATHQVSPIQRRTTEPMQEDRFRRALDSRRCMPIGKRALIQQRFMPFERLAGHLEAGRHERRLRRRKAISPPTATTAATRTNNANCPGRKPSFMAAVASYQRQGVRSRTGSSQSMD